MRLSVGAVLVKGRNIASIGYNGSPAGVEHCLGNTCPGKMRCERTVHAEANALMHLPADMSGPLDLYVTDSPCEHCYRQLVNDGRVDRVFFSVPYRVSDHLLPEVVGGTRAPEVYRITPSGYIMNWRTRELVEVDT